MRELFVDRENLGTLAGDLRFALHEPIPHDPDPSAPQGAYQTLLDCGSELRMYYRGLIPGYTGELFDGNPGEFTGVAIRNSEKSDWQYPKLNLFPGAPANAILFGCVETHNFAPFLDRNPNCHPEERFKAVGGIAAGNGLFAFYSSDGFHWKRYAKHPVVGMIPEMIFSFDSQNVAFYSENEKRYLLYYRVYKTVSGEPLRAVARAESVDFLHWSNHTLINMNRPGEHLYVSLLAPYARAPQLLIGTPTRFFAERGSATDIALIFSNDGYKIHRPFPEAWIRPGADPERWQNRANYLAWNGHSAVDGQLNFFHVRSQVRYSLRADGFTSLSSGVNPGEWRSLKLQVTGDEISFNVSTSAGGGFTVALFDEAGRELPGFGFDDCKEFFGDSLEMRPCWRGGKALLAPGTYFSIGGRFHEASLFSFTH